MRGSVSSWATELVRDGSKFDFSADLNRPLTIPPHLDCIIFVINFEKWFIKILIVAYHSDKNYNDGYLQI